MNLIAYRPDMEINICPRWVLTKSSLPVEVHRHLGMLVSSVVVLALPPFLLAVPHFCLFRLLLGVPCPGCGVLHGMAALLRLDIVSACHSNPASLALCALLVFQITARPVAIAIGGTRSFVTKTSRLGSHIVLASLLLVWGCRLASGGIHAVRLLP